MYRGSATTNLLSSNRMRTVGDDFFGCWVTRVGTAPCGNVTQHARCESNYATRNPFGYSRRFFKHRHETFEFAALKQRMCRQRY